MNLFGAIGNIVGGAEHFIGNLFHGPAQPQQNYRPINLGPGSANLQGGGAQQVQRPQAPQFQIPHLNLNTMQIHQIPVQPNLNQRVINSQPAKPHFNFAGQFLKNLPGAITDTAAQQVVQPIARPAAGLVNNLTHSKGFVPNPNSPIEQILFGGNRVTGVGKELSNTAANFGQTPLKVANTLYGGVTGHPITISKNPTTQQAFNDQALPHSLPGALTDAAITALEAAGTKSAVTSGGAKIAASKLGSKDGFISLGGKSAKASQLESTVKNLNNKRDQLLNSGLSPNHPSVKAVSRAQQSALSQLQAEMRKTQGGSISSDLLTGGLNSKMNKPLPNEQIGGQPKLTQPDVAPTSAGKPSLVQSLAQRPLNILQKSSNPHAQAIAQMTKNAINYSENRGNPAMTSLEDSIKGLKPSEYQQAFLAAEGKAKVSSPAMQKFVDTWHSVRSDIANEAQGKKLTITDPNTGAKFEWQPRGNFAPHYSVQRGSKVNLSDGELNISSPKYGNLEYSRSGNANYIKDPHVMIDYAKKAYRRLGYAGEYGPNNEKLMTAIHQLESTGGQNESAVAQGMVSQLLHPQSPGDNAFLQGVRSAEMISKLPLVSMHHLPQIGDTMAQQGILNTLKSAPAAVKAFISKEASTTTRNAASDVHENPMSYDLNGGGQNLGGKVLDKVYQFPRTLNSLRTLNAEASKLRATQAASNLEKGSNVRALENAGINPKDIAGGKLTPDQINQYIRENLKNASLIFGKGETPLGVQGGVGRTATQLKHFAYNRLVRTWPRVLSEAKHGNPGPLLKTLAFGTAIGTGEQVAQNAIENHPAPTLPSLVEQGALKGLSPGIGVTDAISSAINPKYTASNALGLLGGPAASDAVNLYNTANSYAQGKDRAYQTRNAISSSGPIGATAANYAFPTKSQQGNRPSDILTSGKPSLGRLVTQTNQQSTQATNNALANQVANAKTPSQRVAAEKALQSQISALTKQSAKNPGVQNQINQLRTQKALLSGGQTAVNKMNDTQARASLNQNGGNLQISGNKIYYRNASGSISTVDTGKLTKAKANSTSKTVFQLFQNQQLSQKDMLSVLGKIGVTPQQAEINYARGLGTEDKGAYVMDKLGAGSTAYGLAKAGILTTSVANNLYEGGSIDQKTYAKLYAAASQISKDLKAARTAGGYSSGGAKKLPKPPSISLTKMKAPIKIKAAPAPKPKYTIKSKLPSAASNSRKVTLTA